MSSGFTTPASTPKCPRSCVKCGIPFPEGYGGWGGTHCTACVDWAARDFPFEWEVLRLRKKWKALKLALRAVENAGAWLRAFKRRWPTAAAQGVEEWLVLKAKVEELIRQTRE